MKILRRIGIAGAIWGILSPVSLIIPIMSRYDALTGQASRTNLIEDGQAGDALRFLLPICLMGILGLIGLVYSQREPVLGKILVWLSGLLMFAISVIGIFSLGIFFIPASILLIIGAIGISRKVKVIT